MDLFNGPNQTAIMSAAAHGDRATAGAASGLTRSLAFTAGPLLATTAWSLSGYHTSGMRAGLALAIALSASAVALTLTNSPRYRPVAAPAAASATAA